MRQLGIGGVAIRFIVAASLVCLTWNPTPYNYSRWALANWDNLTAIVVFVGLVMLTAWIIFLRATARSLGVIGIILAVALAGSILWILLEYDLVDPANRDTILAAGISWSHLRRRMAGQLDTDDVGE
jgi:hypothetical protein